MQNNPTGSYVSGRDPPQFVLQPSHDLSLIVDEVFLDYATARRVSFV
jgi:histidinol-phosphate/aromatic aminotransferase/cobyric acid decarboxylase-like protein